MSNYPDGSDNSSAPWNQTEPVNGEYLVTGTVELVVTAASDEEARERFYEQLLRIADDVYNVKVEEA